MMGKNKVTRREVLRRAFPSCRGEVAVGTQNSAQGGSFMSLLSQVPLLGGQGLADLSRNE